MGYGSNGRGPARRREVSARRTAVLAAMVLAACTGAAYGGGDWEITFDAGVAAVNTYPGSDEVHVTPVPGFAATRTAGLTTWFVSLPGNGLGVSRFCPGSGLIATLSANFGAERRRDEYSAFGFDVAHDDETLVRLAGTPNVSTPVVLEAQLQYPTRAGVFGISLGYHPTGIEHAFDGAGDETRHGFVLGLQYAKPVRATSRLTITGVGSVQIMDTAYAESWFALERDTASLAAYDADAGLRDVQAALVASYTVSARVDVTFHYSGALLLADAADSPYTADEFQQSMLLSLSYGF